LHVALSIAGSDSSGGAGMQADLKTFSALGLYGASVITAVTAQNTQGVQSVFPLPSNVVSEQMDSVFDDLPVSAVKTGMLHNVSIVEAVARGLAKYQPENVVIDPVMVSETGVVLLEPDAVEAMRELLLPGARIATPNIHEAEVLSDVKVKSLDDRKRAAEAILGLGCEAVIVTGGHGSGDAVDLMLDSRGFREFKGERIEGPGAHGSGCVFASALAGCLALGKPLEEAVGMAKEFAARAIRSSPGFGKGKSPVNHLHLGDSASALESLARRPGWE